MNFIITNFSMIIDLSPFKWLIVARATIPKVFDQTLAELKATMTKDGNIFWASSTNSLGFEI